MVTAVTGSLVVAVGGSIVANVVEATDARTDALVKRKRAFFWHTDDDDRERCCMVRCYKRRVLGLHNHWALTFDWVDHRVTYEASNVGGYLIPRWNLGGPESVSGSGERYNWEESETFKVFCSPQDVNDKAHSVPYNGAKYILTKINCHLWTEFMARSVGFKHFKLSATDEMFIPEPVASAFDSAI